MDDQARAKYREEMLIFWAAQETLGQRVRRIVDFEIEPTFIAQVGDLQIVLRPADLGASSESLARSLAEARGRQCEIVGGYYADKLRDLFATTEAEFAQALRDYQAALADRRPVALQTTDSRGGCENDA